MDPPASWRGVSGRRWILPGMARFEDQDLTEAEFRECDLTGARLIGVVMRDAVIDGLVRNHPPHRWCPCIRAGCRDRLVHTALRATAGPARGRRNPLGHRRARRTLH